MAQLSDDCFAFGGALMAVEEAQALILERIPPPLAKNPCRYPPRAGVCWPHP